MVQQTGVLPLVAIPLAIVLFTGVTVALGWTELGVLLEALITPLLENDTRVVTATVRVLPGVAKSVCSVLLVNTGVIEALTEAPCVKLLTVDVF